MNPRVLLVLCLLFLQACGTSVYIPSEYAIKQERIDDFPLHGTVVVENKQFDETETVFFDGSDRWVGSLKVVSQHLAEQTQKQIGEHAISAGGDGGKTIGVSVNRLFAETKWFHMVSSMDFAVVLGNGDEFALSVDQGSPNSIQGVLNGTIALGVIEILKDPRVLKYLGE